MKFPIYTITIIILSAAQTGYPQQPTRYERKSVSYVNALWIIGDKAAKAKPDQIDYILNSVKHAVEMPRFDYNPLPDRLVTDFVAAANASKGLTVDELAGMMDDKLTPAILSILDAELQARAANLVFEADRRGFLATKAKELGITLDEMEKVMNSAYIYLPYINGLSWKKGDVKGKFTCRIEGGIIWFQVITDGVSHKVKHLKTLSTESYGFGSDQFSFESAVDNFARNLAAATRRIGDFRLGAPVVEVEGGKVRFAIGKREGVGLDETYIVGDWMDTEGGEIKFQRLGWVKVVEIPKNGKKTDLTTAIAIKRDIWAPGMSVVEHPRLGIDIAPKPGLFHTRISAGSIPLVGTIFSGQYLTIDQDYDQYAVGADLDAHIGLAGLTGKVGTRFLIGLNLTAPVGLKFTVPSGTLTLLTTSPPFVWGVHGGYMRKHYFGRLNLTYELLFGARFFSVRQEIEFDDREYSFTIFNNSIGGQAGLGLDWAATPDFNWGVMGGWRFYTVSDSWTVQANIGGELVSADFSGDDTLPDINHSGLFFVIYLHWSLPALPFDPLGWIKGMAL